MVVCEECVRFCLRCFVGSDAPLGCSCSFHLFSQHFSSFLFIPYCEINEQVSKTFIKRFHEFTTTNSK